jgi:putative oxidoreductase
MLNTLITSTPLVQNAALLIARIPLGLMFAYAGYGKIIGFAGTQAYMASAGVPGAMLPLVIATELGLGLALLVGFQTRIAALLFAGFTVVATLLFHMDLANQVQFLFFTKNLAIAGGLMALVAAGAGAWSVDGQRGNAGKVALA